MEVTATKVAVSLSRATATVQRFATAKEAVSENNPWTAAVTVKGGGWESTTSDDIPPF